MTKALKPFHFLFFISIILVLYISGCVLIRERVAPDSQEHPTYIPPTFVPTSIPATATPTSLPQSNSSDNKQKCTNLLTYISDLSVSDGTVVPPDSTIDKRWSVENSGTCNWGNGYKLKLINGDPMGVAVEQVLIPAQSNTKAEIRILFTAPKTPQKYIGVWQAYTPEGQPFGDAFYINIVVKK